MSDYRVASRYAKSLIDLSIEKGVLDDVNNDMVAFSEVCTQNHDFYLMLKNPIINHDKKLKILKALFSDKFNALSLAIFELITRKHREAFLPAIAKEFHHQYNVNQGIETATVVTTFPLTDVLRKEFNEAVHQLTGKTPELIEEVDESIIGGFILKLGDKQVDDSISGKLKELKLEFSHNPYVKTQ